MAPELLDVLRSRTHQSCLFYVNAFNGTSALIHQTKDTLLLDYREVVKK